MSRSLRVTSQAARKNRITRDPPWRASLDSPPAAARTAVGTARAAIPRPAESSISRPFRSITARSAIGSIVSRSCVVRSTMQPCSRRPDSRCCSATVAASSRPVNGSSSSTSRGSCSSARSSARRWRMPREKPGTGSSRRSRQAGALERRVDATLEARHAVHPAEEPQVLRCRELRIEVEIVAEQADARAQ